MRLYEIAADLRALFDKIEANDGDMTDDDVMQLEELQLNYDTKVEGTALYIKNLEAEADMIKVEEERLRARRKANENKAGRLRAYLAYVLDEPLKTAKVSLSKRKTRSVFISEHFHIQELTQLQLAKEVVEYKADKTAIKKYIEDNGIDRLEDSEGNSIVIKESESLIIK